MQTYDAKPKRRLFEVLAAQGMQANQQVTFITDGGEDIRDLPLYLNPEAEHLLDWFHVTMRITVMANIAKGLRSPPPDPTSRRRDRWTSPPAPASSCSASDGCSGTATSFAPCRSSRTWSWTSMSRTPTRRSASF